MNDYTVDIKNATTTEETFIDNIERLKEIQELAATEVAKVVIGVCTWRDTVVECTREAKNPLELYTIAQALAYSQDRIQQLRRSIS